MKGRVEGLISYEASSGHKRRMILPIGITLIISTFRLSKPELLVKEIDVVGGS